MLCNESDSILNAFFLPRFSSIRSPNEFHSTFLSPVIVIIVKYHKLKSISYHIPILWNACFFFVVFFRQRLRKFTFLFLFFTPHIFSSSKFIWLSPFGKLARRLIDIRGKKKENGYRRSVTFSRPNLLFLLFNFFIFLYPKKMSLFHPANWLL